MAPSPMRPVDAAAAQPPPAGGGSAARFQPPLSRSASSGDYFGLTPSRAVARTPTGASSGLSGGGQASRLLWRGAFGLADGSALDGLAFVSHLAFPGAAGGVRTGGTSPAGSGGFGIPAAAATFNPFSPSFARSQGQELQEASPTASALPSQDPDLGLSLALESLRGRAAVHFRGRVALNASPETIAAGRPGPLVEGNGGVRLYVDPTCPALYAFLYRQLLILPAPDATVSPSGSGSKNLSSPALDSRGRSLSGILVSLGDESVGEAPLVIYALEALKDRPGMTFGRPNQRTLGLHVGIYHAPPSETTTTASASTSIGRSLVRPSLSIGVTSAPAILGLGSGPSASGSNSILWSADSRAGGSVRGSGARPDDPAPRRVPDLKDVLARGKRRRDEATAEAAQMALPSLIGTDVASTIARHPPAKRRAKLVKPTHGLLSAKVSNDGEGEPMDGILSSRSTDVARTSSTPADDDEPATTDEAVEMRDDLDLPPAPGPQELSDGGTSGTRKKSLYEADNKTTIKRVAMQALAERGLAKADGRFKDVWNMVSRGALYAFRDELAGRVLGMRDILNVVEGHLDLYLRPASFEKG